MKISIKKGETFMVDKDYYFPGDEYVIDLDAEEKRINGKIFLA